jgi:riboflavin synthase
VFTGLVEAVGRIVEVSPRRGSTRLAVVSPLGTEGAAEGDSVAVDGVCLTVSARQGERFWADVVAETLARSTLARARAGRRVNLERSLRLGERLGGHLVQGHVDDVAEVLRAARRGDDRRLRVALPEALGRYVALKGSVALDGVSLTVAALGEGWLEVALVPVTVARTTLGERRPGDAVNVEVDLVARYLERLARAGGGGRPRRGR